MNGVNGPSGVLGSSLVHDRKGGRGGPRPDADAFREALQQQGQDPGPEPEDQGCMARALQRRAVIGRREDGEAHHVDVVA